MSTLNDLLEKAISGDQDSLEQLLSGVEDMIFNLSLRMLETIPDAEDASQEILIKVKTHLSSFRQESSLSTWVFRIAANHLKSYKKHMFADRPLGFEFYGADITEGEGRDVPDLTGGIDFDLLSMELKLSCTNRHAPVSGPGEQVYLYPGYDVSLGQPRRRRGAGDVPKGLPSEAVAYPEKGGGFSGLILRSWRKSLLFQ